MVEGDRAKLTLFTDRDFSFNFTVDVMTMDITATGSVACDYHVMLSCVHHVTVF